VKGKNRYNGNGSPSKRDYRLGEKRNLERSKKEGYSKKERGGGGILRAGYSMGQYPSGKKTCVMFKGKNKLTK